MYHDVQLERVPLSAQEACVALTSALSFIDLEIWKPFLKGVRHYAKYDARFGSINQTSLHSCPKCVSHKVTKWVWKQRDARFKSR
jgi:hypothetical protein